MEHHEFVQKVLNGEPITVDELADEIESLLTDFDETIEQLDRRKQENKHMGAFDAVPNITIPDPNGGQASDAYREKHGPNATAEQEFREKWGWEPHEQVIIRGAFTQGDQEAIGNAASKASDKGKLLLQAGTGRTKLLEQMIVDWTLSQNGRKVEVSPKAIRRLPAQYSTPILEKCDELASAMTEEEQEDFLDSVSEPTEESSEPVSPSRKRS